uniref:Isochorismatase-like domain-containing protein n=1 Tax=Alexandrium monilatum TaxID=311494 RepID=A0A7S4PUC9_9DINO
MPPLKRPAAAEAPAAVRKKPAASDGAAPEAPAQAFAAPPASEGPVATLDVSKPKAVDLPLKSTALLCIDFQKDFLDEGGFGHALGNDVTQLFDTCFPGGAILLAAARKCGLTIVHTKEAHCQDLSDCPASKRCGPRAPPEGKRVGDVLEEGMGKLLVDGSLGNDFIEAAKPWEGEKVVCKPGKGAFFHTDLQDYLFSKGISHLIVCGVTTEVCVQTTMREANDRGYECVLVEDATASYIPEFKEAVVKMVSSQGGIVGYTIDMAEKVADAIKTAHSGSG